MRILGCRSLIVCGFIALAARAETLYNGIELPEVWPPADRAPSREPMDTPYLQNPPPIVPIDVGRQLFVDDFLIESTTLKRTFHNAEYYPNNPVMSPDKEWEGGESQGHPAPTAMPFSDGVWYDTQEQLFKMWYMGGYTKSTCYAESKDGIHWTKPELDIVPGTNIVQPHGRDSVTVWLDRNDPDPARRYKMFSYLRPDDSGRYTIYVSADGKHWGDPVATSGPTGDRCSVFYNPFRKVWVYNIRAYDPKTIGRFRRYHEGADAIEAAKWKEGEPLYWVGADTGDYQREELKTPCELYNLDCVAYESLLIGLFSIWRGQPTDRAKPNEICIGFSRDGYYWDRPSHAPFIPVSDKYGDWNWGNVQSTGGCCLVVGDKLYFYVSGRKGVQGSPSSGVCSTGLATIRRDGFASLDAIDSEGTLTTRPLKFNGKHLFINADASRGEIRVEILPTIFLGGRLVTDKPLDPVEGFEARSCVRMVANATRAQIAWQGGKDLSSLVGMPVQFRFHVKNAHLYSFWVSDDLKGASNGYVAAGGPQIAGATDSPASASQ
ncbi:MAG: hypothetical protein IT366_00190 [Candidatus Hydrogenedentes bacterium]|nr:hypothetical protein [Candidatus Hydrogenedentota bacterium]